MSSKRLQYCSLVALRIAPDAAQHSGPRAPEHQEAAVRAGGDLRRRRCRPRRRCRGREASRSPAWWARAPGSGVIMIPPVSVCHQVSTIGQRLPPITRWYQIHASGLIGSPTVPSRRSDERSWRFGCSSPSRMKRADRRGRRVEDRHAVPLDHLPEAVGARVGRHALVHQRGRAVGEDPVDDVGMAR